MGEPFLHPKFKEIIKFLDEEGLSFALSTNASKVILLDNNELKNLKYITFSMCGFSQKSYDKIHGFNFEQIKRNISEILDNFKKNGFKGDAYVSYHVYQFNINEIPNIIKFCNEQSMGFSPAIAFINDFERFKKYIKSELDYNDLKKATQELLLYYVDEMIEEKDKEYYCPQFDCLSVDENCNIITCCLDSSIYGKIYNSKADDINNWRMNSSVCKECNNIGLNYVVNTSKYFNLDIINKSILSDRYKKYYLMNNKWIQNLNNKKLIGRYLKQNNIKRVSIYGLGDIAHNLFNELNNLDIKVDSFICSSLDTIESDIAENVLIVDFNSLDRINSDLIIITPIYEFENIRKKLKLLGCETKIESLENIIQMCS